MLEIDKTFAEWLLDGATRKKLLTAVSQKTGYKIEALNSLFFIHPTSRNTVLISEKWMNFSALKVIYNKRGVFLYPLGRKYKKVPILKPMYMKQFSYPNAKRPYNRRLHKLNGPKIVLPDLRPFVKHYARDNIREIWVAAWS